MTACGCKPGTPENGWHEERCAECDAEEAEVFAQAVEAWSRLYVGLKAARNTRSEQ